MKEFKGILDFNGVPVNDVFVGMTQYKSLADLERVQHDIENTTVAENYFSTFEAECYLTVEVNYCKHKCYFDL